ncbi:hypothetical protein ABZ215_38505 [Amycolatopsis sp. NPDC006131]|uniref:hypothetical protein n=1 Tax=Amycolatopsis sp. NPDC006131 TaxID=3156731 RepID=UPI0033AD20E2
MTAPLGSAYFSNVNITPTSDRQRTRPQWVWNVGDWRGLPDRQLRQATGRQLKLSLLEPSGASFSINGDSTEALYITDLVTDLRVLRNGVPLYRGRVTATGDDIDETGYSLKVDTVDYRGLLDRRLLFTDKTYTNTAQETIAWDLLSYAKSQAGGDLQLTRGQWPSTGVTRASVEFKDGDSIWDCLVKLMAMDNAFELDITPQGVVNLYWPQKGGLDKGVLLDYGGNIKKASGQTRDDTYANAVRQSGADSVAPSIQTVADIGSRPEGRWDVALGDTALTTTQMVTETAKFQLNQYSQLRTAWTLTFKAGKWRGPEHVWLGDIVTYSVKRGRRFDVGQARVYELTIDVDESGGETVSVTIDKPRDDDAKLIKRMAKKVRYLSKR